MSHSHIYDNWERLVAAVVKKQQLWELFHAHSRNSSTSSSVSTDFSSTFSRRISFIRRSKEPILEFNFNEILEAENLDGPASIFQDEWIELYESGVYMTLSALTLRDGTHVDVTRVQFSGIRFDAVQAKTWWNENQKKVYDTYNVKYGIRRSKEPILEINFNEILEAENLDGPDGPASVLPDEWIDQYESGVYMTLSATRDGTLDVKRVQFSGIRFHAVQAKTWWLENQKKVYDTFSVKYGIRRCKEPILEINFNEILEAENLDGPDGPASVFPDEWIDQYESGVYMTLSATRDGTLDVKRVQFSGIRFDAVQAKFWWLENQKQVYETYNVRDGKIRRRFKKQEAEAKWSGKKWKFYKFFNEITRVRQSSSKATSNKKELFSKGSEENKALNKPNKLILQHGGKKEPILEINFNEWSECDELGKCKKWIERYECGVYITLSALKDGTVDVERVRFSRIRFDAEQVKNWWLENQKNVCERHKLSQPSSQV